MAWVERRAPNDPFGRLTIIVLGNQERSLVLTQLAQLRNEDPASVAEALKMLASTRPREANLAWSVVFKGHPSPWE